MDIIKMTDKEEFTGFYLLKTAEVKVAANGSHYLEMTLTDKTGSIPAKMWDISSQDKETFFPMSIVKIQGVCQLYREKLQVIVKRMRLATEEDGVSVQEFVKAAPVPPVDLVHGIHQAINRISHKEMRQIVEYCVAKVEDALMHAPAAMKNHHAYYAGLAYHMNRMLEIGEFIIKQRPFLNADLLRAGIIAHDLAKVMEMNSQLGIAYEYTVEGNLIGHIVMVNDWITEAAIHFGIPLQSELVIGLKHMVLSHHGKGEYGSPKSPQLPEAVALHMIDMLDAALQACEDALDETAAHEPWTPKIKIIENQALYRLKLNDERFEDEAEIQGEMIL
jgi:3'-5' exoribonuclease